MIVLSFSVSCWMIVWNYLSKNGVEDSLLSFPIIFPHRCPTRPDQHIFKGRIYIERCKKDLTSGLLPFSLHPFLMPLLLTINSCSDFCCHWHRSRGAITCSSGWMYNTVDLLVMWLERRGGSGQSIRVSPLWRFQPPLSHPHPDLLGGVTKEKCQMWTLLVLSQF